MAIIKTEEAFQAARDMLLISGLWPMENKTWRYKLKTAISWVAILGLCLTMWMEFFNDLHDLVKLCSIFYILVAFMNAIIKQIGFTTNHKTLQETLILLKNPVFITHSEELDQYMADTVKFSTRFAKGYQLLIGCVVVLIGVFPIIDKKPLPFPFPYDVGNYQALMYTFQMSCESVSAWNHACLDSICISLLGLASAQLDILAEKIVQIKTNSALHKDSDKREKVVLNQLKHCVDHHLAIITLIENIEKIFNVGILAQYLASSLIICITIFSFLLVPPSWQLAMLGDYLIYIMVQLYTYCWYGNELLIKTRQIGDACYIFNWYDYGLRVRKSIFIIMERSKRPSYVTALKFTPISLTSLTTILRWSYSFLALLLNMYQKGSVTNN